jgi:hypothetical protein
MSYIIFPTEDHPQAGTDLEGHDLVDDATFATALLNNDVEEFEILLEALKALDEDNPKRCRLNAPTHISLQGSVATIVTTGPKSCKVFETEDEETPVALAWYCLSVEPIYEANFLTPVAALWEEIATFTAEGRKLVIVAEDNIFELIYEACRLGFVSQPICEYGYRMKGNLSWFDESTEPNAIVLLPIAYVTPESIQLALKYTVLVVGDCEAETSVKRALA